MSTPATDHPTDDSARTMRGAGLCAQCQHAQLVKSARGSVFLLCRLSKTNPDFDKYPRLPVLHCDGFEPPDSEQVAD